MPPIQRTNKEDDSVETEIAKGQTNTKMYLGGERDSARTGPIPVYQC